MYNDVIYNRHMFFRDRFYEYKRFCERIASSKSNCHPPPPTEYPFLKLRNKKHQMEKEKKEDIEYNRLLLIKKYKSMYKNHNKYHPSNLRFQPHPPSLKFSTGTQQYYEIFHNNLYLGNKIKQIQNGTGNYNSKKCLSHYKKMREIGDKIAERSKYKNLFLDIISPYAYEKRLNKMLEEKEREKKRLRQLSTEKDRPRIYYRTGRDFYRPNTANDIIHNNNFDSSKNSRKIIIERENIQTTKEETEGNRF